MISQLIARIWLKLGFIALPDAFRAADNNWPTDDQWLFLRVQVRNHTVSELEAMFFVKTTRKPVI